MTGWHHFPNYSVCCVCSVASVVPNNLWPVDCSPPGSPVHGILQPRISEWVTMPFSRGSFWPRDWTRISGVSCIAGRFFSHLKVKNENYSVVSSSLQLHGLYIQSMEFSRPDYWSGWVAFPCSRGFFQPRNWTRVSCTAGRFITSELSGKPLKHLGSSNYSDFLPYFKLLDVFTKYPQFPLFCYEDPAAGLSGFRFGSIIY